MVDMRLAGNPFVLRARWALRRRSLGWARCACVLILLLALKHELGLQGPILVLGGLTWFTVLTFQTVASTATVYARERDLGVRTVLGTAPISAAREIIGRWLAAMARNVEPWLLGGVFPLVSCLLLDPQGIERVVLGIWLLCIPWLGAVAAVGLVCSIAFRTMVGSLAVTLAALMGAPVLYMAMPLVFSSVTYAYGVGPAPSGHDVAPLACLPPSPFLFLAVAEPRVLLWLLPAWLLFIPATLWIGAVLIRSGWSIEPPGRQRVQSSLLPAPHAHRIDPSDRATAMGWSPFDSVLGGNPFYVAWRKGFMRLYPTLSAPGSLLPPIFVITALIIPTAVGMCGTTMPDGPMQGLVLGALAAASFYGAWEGLMLGARSLSSERDRATWPLLVVTGMRPGRILAGKFATSFYALSGEWVWTLPFWLACALATKSPAMLLLPWIQPLAIATGVIIGLWVASQPKVPVRWAPIAAFGLVALAGVVAVVAPAPVLELSAFDPVPVVERLAVGRLEWTGFGVISLWVAFWLACFGAGWTWTGLCLRRVMRCD